MNGHRHRWMLRLNFALSDLVLCRSFKDGGGQQAVAGEEDHAESYKNP